MAETTPAAEDVSQAQAAGAGDLRRTWQLLWLTYGLVPVVAGLDKFTNLLVDWSTYLPGAVADVAPLAPDQFMMVVGAIEVVAGVAVLSRFTREAAYVVAAWLLAIAVVVTVGGNYDVAVRDAVMAVGAVALARLSEHGDFAGW